MNCCDYNCNQGRDCPACATCKHCHGIGYDASGHPCTCTMPANVAKVGARMPGPEPLRGSSLRQYLRHLAYWMLMAFFGLLLWSGILLAVVYA